MTRPTWGVVVLSGSSGRLETARASTLRSWGLAAEPYQWFGGQDQTPGVCEVPLESFGPALDAMAGRAVLGVSSRGSEATRVKGPITITCAVGW